MSYSNDYDFITINLKESVSPNTIYHCNWCHRKLFYKERDKETSKHIWVCTFCNIEHIPDNELVKKASRFDIPQGSDPSQDRVPPIAMIDDVNKEVSFTSYKQQKLTPSFEALKKQGFKFINYEER
jgi:hypothetical protein